MNKNGLRRVLLLGCLLMISLMMWGCSSSSSDSKTDGLIFNQTPYRAQINFHGVKIVEVLSGQLLGEYDLKRSSAYVYQITIYNGSTVLEVIDHFIDIPYNPGYYRINGRGCNWYINISGSKAPFQVVSAS